MTAPAPTPAAQPAQGGSYMRLADGSLKRVAQTAAAVMRGQEKAAADLSPSSDAVAPNSALAARIAPTVKPGKS